MRKTMIIEFNPQNKDKTIEAMITATSKELMNVADCILLKPDSNLISMECLHLLNKDGFYARKTLYGDVFKYVNNKEV